MYKCAECGNPIGTDSPDAWSIVRGRKTIRFCSQFCGFKFIVRGK